MIEYIILSSIAGLFIFYQLLQWRSNRQLKKLERRYNPQNDTSRRENQPGPIAPRYGGVIQREPVFERVAEPQRPIILETPDNKPVPNVERNIEQDKPKTRKFWLFGRRKEKVNQEIEML